MVLPRSCGACRGLEGACQLWLPLSPSRAPKPLPRRPRGLQRTEVALTNHLHLFLPTKMKTTALACISAFPSLSCDPEGRGKAAAPPDVWPERAPLWGDRRASRTDASQPQKAGWKGGRGCGLLLLHATSSSSFPFLNSPRGSENFLVPEK